MKKFFATLFIAFAVTFAFAQNTFEGTLNVTYKNDKEQSVIAEVKVKGDLVYIKQKTNGVKKYDHFILNLKTKDFYTVSLPDKKVYIKYNLDKLINFYNDNDLKEGYSKDYNLTFKLSDKTKVENGLTVTRAIAENDSLKGTVWVADVKTPLSQLIPLLRLMGNWNEAEGTTETITEAEMDNHNSKKQTSVIVTIKKEPITKETFDLPKGYTARDFDVLMDDKRGAKDLNVIVGTFAGF